MSRITEALNRAQKEFSKALEEASEVKEKENSPFIKEPLGDLRGLRPKENSVSAWSRIKPFLVIGLFLLCVFIFIFGVRQGKKIDQMQTIETSLELNDESSSDSETSMLYAIDDAGQPIVFSNGQWINYESSMPSEEVPEQELEEIVDVIVKSEKDFPYSIQLITYSDSDRAEEEVVRLNQKGFQAFIIPSGNLFQVAVNRFEDARSAKDFLNSLQSQFLKKYPGAYVRSIQRRS